MSAHIGGNALFDGVKLEAEHSEFRQKAEFVREFRYAIAIQIESVEIGESCGELARVGQKPTGEKDPQQK